MRFFRQLPILLFIVVGTIALSNSSSYGGQLEHSITKVTTVQSNDPNDTVLKFESFLRAESKDHREFLESYYTKVIGVIAFIGAVFGSVLTWLNWKSKDDIRKQVNEQFKQTVEDIITEKLSQVDVLLKESREKSDHQVKEINYCWNFQSDQKRQRQQNPRMTFNP